MSDHHEAQDYKANGPTAVGFRTGGNGTGITDGVVASGKRYGVHGISIKVENNTDPETWGVFGESVLGGGVKGTSTNMNGVHGSSRFSSGVFGSTSSKDWSAGVKGDGDNIGVAGYSRRVGVYGSSTKEEGVATIMDNNEYVGVLGESDQGVGVLGHSNLGSGIRGTCANNIGYGGVFASSFAQIRLEPAPSTFGPPKSGLHKKGEFFVDERGALFYCVGGSPAVWQKLAGPSWFSTLVSFVKRAFALNK